MKLKAITFALMIGTIAMGCSSEHSSEKDAQHENATAEGQEGTEHSEGHAGTGPGTGTGSLHGENTANAGTHEGASDTTAVEAAGGSARMIPNGTGTSTATKKPDTLRGKWPTQAYPYY